MDLIRIFAEIAFVRIGQRYLDETTLDETIQEPDDKLMLDEAMFVDEGRIHHPELSDDQLRVVYRIYRDEWSLTPDETGIAEFTKGSQHIFNALFLITKELLRYNAGKPRVKFRHLFRWRELTLLTGEDLLACAGLAYQRRDYSLYDFRHHGAPDNKTFLDFCGWPTILHNDNTHLNYIFDTVGLCELHSHLKASTDNFNITWVCLMNHIGGRTANFEKLAKTQNPSRFRALSSRLYSYAALAASIRYQLWMSVINGKGPDHSIPLPKTTIDTVLKELDEKLSLARNKDNDFDYISDDSNHPMNIFAGERMFLYAMFERILRSDNIFLHKLFYKYILLKNIVRSFLVQVNNNNGFNNFKRYQDLKSIFLLPAYNRLLSWLPMWEAKEFNYAVSFEARIAPPGEVATLNKELENAKSYLKGSKDDDRDFNWSYIFHFLKFSDDGKSPDSERNLNIRTQVSTGGNTLRNLLKIADVEQFISGIDAASSEIACRPEAFAQVFRYLKGAGYAATFHAGEDFYDIADGLRAIFESIVFLELEAGDRIGHAIAMGIDASEFYRERHNYIILPIQWLIDNVVWCYYFAKKQNVSIDPQTETFLLATARNLLVETGYEDAYGGSIDLYDYYQAILLRGDNPKLYRDGTFKDDFTNGIPDGVSWHNFNLQSSPMIKEIRRYNHNAVRLYNIYHFNRNVKHWGEKVKSIRVPDGYVNMITDLQTKIMKEVSKRRIGIECCPSSNLKIGHLHRFDRHPIFRFMPVRADDTRYPLAVTVNTDDLGIFATSLPNEYSLLALALLKINDSKGNPLYTSSEVYDWIKRVAENGRKYRFGSLSETVSYRLRY